MFICHKTIDNLTWNDIKNITIAKVKEYRDHLIEEDFASSTINQRILACKALWDDFFENEKVDKNVFDLKKLKQVKNHWDSLTDKEMQMLYKFCLDQPKKPITKQLYCEFLYTTGLRKNIAQSIFINDIKRKLDVKSQQEFWVIDVIDKEHPRDVAITDDFYYRLVNNPENDGKTDEKLFHIYNKTIDNLLKAFCDKYNITRKIKQHSLKGSGGDLVQNVYGDINKTAKYLGHENIQTSYEYYLGKNESYSEQPSFALHKGYSIDMLKDLGEDVLIGLIERYTEKQGRDIVIKLCMELEEMTK
jgi:site-specific recombinase XerD